MGRQLKQDQLVRLERHTYSSSNASLLDPIMQHWWCWLVKRCPMSLAPNLITITGLIINIVTCLVLIYYSPDARQEVPRWGSFLCAVGLFVYQSLDAIDGKQARRTGSSSPLGELFDHGCDSVSTVFVSLSVCCAVQLGTHPYWMFFQCIMATILFYCAHWQAYVSGTLKFGLIDVTEAQLCVMTILMISAIFGSSIWNTEVFGFDFRNLYILIGLAQSFIKFRECIPVILYEGGGKNGSSIADTSVLSPSVPLFLVIAPAILIAWKSPDGVYLHNPSLYLLTFGFVLARVTNRLVVAHMSKSVMDYTDASLLGPATLFLNQYFNCPISEHFLLWMVFIYVTYDLIKYCREVCLDICSHLRISLFIIDSPKKENQATSSPTEKNGSFNKYNTRGQDSRRKSRQTIS